MEKENHLKKLLPRPDQVHRAAASRQPSPSQSSPVANDHKYPPKGPVCHQQIKDAVVAGYCIGCWRPNNTVCIEQGCAGAAAAGFVLTQDAMKAKDIFDCYLSNRANISHSRNNQSGQQGRGHQNNPWGNARCTQGDNEKDHSIEPSLTATQPEEVVAAGKCATSGDKKPSPSPQISSHNYFDELASDSDDDAEFCFDFTEDNPKTNSSAYITFATACHAAIQSASSPLAALARCEFTKIKIALHSEDEVACCVDSGATKHMFPDYTTFVSYRRVYNKVVTLGDGSPPPILGRGTAKFSINKHVILVRNVLHVPGLSAPLYSLHQHRLMPGCGFFFHFDCGAFLLFPTFSVKVDDSEDCLVNFKAVGTRPLAPIDYAEPCDNSHHAAARPVHLIPTDDDSDLLSKIEFHLPDPKACPSPHRSPPSSLDQQHSATPSPTPDDSLPMS